MTARSTPALKLDLDKLEDLHIAEGANVAETSANPDDELERFRNQWRNEVKAKRQDEGSTRPGKREETSVTTKKTEGLHAGDNETSNATTTTATLSIKSTQPDEAPAAGPSRVAPLTTPASRTVKPAPKMMSKKDQAVQLYARAVEREQIGQLSEALMLYRKAFKLDGGSFLRNSTLDSIIMAALQTLSTAYTLETSPRMAQMTPHPPCRLNRQPLLPPTWSLPLHRSTSLTLFNDTSNSNQITRKHYHHKSTQPFPPALHLSPRFSPPCPSHQSIPSSYPRTRISRSRSLDYLQSYWIRSF